MLRLLSIFAVIGISLLLTSCYTISKKGMPGWRLERDRFH